MRRFMGQSHHKVDAKGRVSIPASFRRQLERSDPNWTEGLSPELVIVYGDETRDFLECYSIEAITEVGEKIDALPRGSNARLILEELFDGQSFPTTVDDTGRLVLPAKLREKIGLEKEAFFIGSGDTFRIWKPETYGTKAGQTTRNWRAKVGPDVDATVLLDNPEMAE